MNAHASVLCLAVLSCLLLVPAVAPAQGNVSPDEARQIAIEAYIYGYPLVTMETTRRVMTNVAAPSGTHAPMGQMVRMRKYPDASFKDVTAPNADTLYSPAWLDLAKEPYVLSLPDEDGRYYLMPMLSGWTDVFEVPGKRTTGTQAQTYAITGPNWKGQLPEGVKELKSPTNMVWILGRTYCAGTPDDYKACHAIMDKYQLVPLSAYGKPYTPPAGKVDPEVDMRTPVREQVHKLDAVAYFTLLAKLMKDNPPAAADAPMVARMAKIGLVPGLDFDPSKLPATVAQVVPKTAQEQIMGHFKQGGSNINGWIFTTKAGVYGIDYLQRAFITAIGLGANRPQDAVYPTSEVDADGNPYSGANNYVLHFPKGETPPANAFWSITMYDGNYFFVDNPLNKYTVSPRNDLQYNADGSLDLYIQSESPGKDKEANWLPAPKGKFILMLRMYWPKESDPSIINGTWKPPGVKLVAPAMTLAKVTPEEARQIAIEAYVYGYSLVTTDVTRVQMSNVPQAEGLRAPMNQFVNVPRYPPASYRGVSAPNADTLYSLAWVDLKEPMVFSHPDMGDRFYLFEMVDLWMTIFDSPGKRTAGGKPQTYILTGPGWTGEIPKNTKEIKCATRYMVILGRTYSSGTPQDYAAVNELQSQLKLHPLSTWAQDYNYVAPPVNPNPGFSMTDKPQTAILGMGTAGYFNLMARLMGGDAPAAKADAPMLERMAKIGIVPGQPFDLAKLDPAVQAALKDVPEAALKKIEANKTQMGGIADGWIISKGLGVYGTDYMKRAVVAAFGWPANLQKDAVYPYAETDSDGQALTGANKYTLTFPDGQTPPVNGFWSITMYEIDQGWWFVPNALNKFTVSPRNNLKPNADGSLTLYFQNESPGSDKEANWLPAPKGPFILMLRMYWPKEQTPSIIDGSWMPPPVKRVK